MLIAIDGPSASGKSSAARQLAQDLGYIYLSSGMIFRALSYALYHHFSYTPETITTPKAADIAAALAAIRYVFDQKSYYIHILYQEEDITAHLKSAEIDQLTSLMSQNSAVREAIRAFQHQFVIQRNVIVEGRDIGTVVFPDAPYKFFMGASEEVRAERWLRDQQKKGVQIDLATARAALHKRDTRDTERAVAPLRKAADAHYIDTTHLTLAEVVEVIKKIISHPA